MPQYVFKVDIFLYSSFIARFITISAITNYFSSSSSHDSSSKKGQPQPTTKKKSRADRLQNSKFKPEWSKIYPCIYYKDGAMFCKDCQDAGIIIAYWFNTFSIGCNTFMKDNIQKHIKTADHKKALQTKTMKPDFDQGVANANQYHETDVTSANLWITWPSTTS